MVGLKVILLFFIIAFAISAFLLFMYEGDSESCLFCCMSFIIFIMIYICVLSFEKKQTDYEKICIVECQDIKSFSLHSENASSGFGSFTLGCGYVYSNSSMDLKYYFYKKGQVGYVLCSIDAGKVEIVETDDKPPCIEGFFNYNGGLKSNETYIIYVPVGTIYEEYKVQL